jgi:hypothetical protein
MRTFVRDGAGAPSYDFSARDRARELPRRADVGARGRRLDLGEALELLNLIALHELRLYAARRWLVRLLEERQALTVVDAQLAASALAALPTASHDGTLGVLRSLAAGG